MPPRNTSYAELNKLYANEKDLKDQDFGDYSMIAIGTAWPEEDKDTRNFAEFYRKDMKGAEQSHWKAHFSVIGPQVGKAWDVVYPVLAEQKAYKFKVYRQVCGPATKRRLAKSKDASAEMRQQAIADIDRLETHAQITVYLPTEKNKELDALPEKVSAAQKMLVAVEAALVKAKVSQAILLPDRDRWVGQYCSIVYEEKGVTWEKRKNYKPKGVKDPFAEVGKVEWEQIEGGARRKKG